MPADGKPRVNCTECRRRKQKCDRRWPCIHCRKRRVAQFCHFDSTTVDEGKGRRESLARLSEKPQTTNMGAVFGDLARSENSVAPTLQAWGYSKGIEHFNLGHLQPKVTPTTPSTESDTTKDYLQAALQSLPARSLTDRLVQHYLQNLNYVYYSIYPPSFLTDYNRFWVDRAACQDIDVSFLGLLLQMCANAAQCADEPLKNTIEYDITEALSSFAERLRDAAVDAAYRLTPGSGGMNRVLQLLLEAAWLKGQGQIVDGWHMLTRAVHEAQECGFVPGGSGAEVTSKPTSEIHQELRKRIWCYIVIWDWQMAEWLDRPMLIDLRSSPLCVLNWGLDGEIEGEPSPFEGTFQQYKLVHSIVSSHRRLSKIEDSASIEQILSQVDRWQEKLPPHFKADGADSDWDTKYPWLPLQRTLLHCFAEMVRFTPLKQILTASSCGSSELAKPELRYVAIEMALRVISTATKLHGILSPIKLKFHFIVFVLFDTAAVLCSALLHDSNEGFEHREGIVDAVHSAIQQLDQLSSCSKSAQTSSGVLRYLLSKLPHSADAQQAPKTFLHPPPLQDADTLKDIEDFQQNGSDWSQKLDRFLPSDGMDLNGLDDLDFGGMEQIWSWDGLNINWLLS